MFSYANSHLTVFKLQKGFFQSCYVGEGLFVQDGHKMTVRCFLSGGKRKGRLPFPQPLHRDSGVQTKSIFRRNQNPQILPPGTADGLKPADVL